MNSVRLYIVNFVFFFLPPTRGWALKRTLLRWAGAKIGSGVRIVSSVRIHMTGPLEIGDNSFVGHEVLISGGDAPVIIGARVDIGPRVTIVTGTHELRLGEDRAAGQGSSLPIVIGDGSWICVASTILGGAQLGRSSCVAAGSLVRSYVADASLVAGVPARPKK